MLPSELMGVPQSAIDRLLDNKNVKSADIITLFRELDRYRKLDEINVAHRAVLREAWMDSTSRPKLHIVATSRSTEGDKDWIQDLVFMSPSISPTPTPTHRIPIEVKGAHGEVWYLATMKLTTPIKVRCSCPDFRHSFSWQDHDIGSLKGRRLSYLSTGQRPPRNPDNIPGLCKHLGSVFNTIQVNTDLLVKSPRLRPDSLYI